MSGADDNWTAGDAYENYMGRWSRPLARAFVSTMAPPPGGRWLDVGCGTGALTHAICEIADPASVVACDPSESFVAHARKTIPGNRASCVVGSAEDLPGPPGSFDWVVSGLVLNFVRDPVRVIGLMRERLRRGGIVAAYVWDYGDGVEFLRRFWDEAVALDPAASDLDEGRRFPLCRPEALTSLFAGAGLARVRSDVLDIPTRFRDFQDFWGPFLRGTGPAPSYAASLPPARRDQLRDRLAGRLTVDADGSIRLTARAWAVRGVSE